MSLWYSPEALTLYMKEKTWDELKDLLQDISLEIVQAIDSLPYAGTEDYIEENFRLMRRVVDEFKGRANRPRDRQ